MPDSVKRRYHECLVRMGSTIFLKDAPTLDIWFFDNALSRPAEMKADWEEDGKGDSRAGPRIAVAFQQGRDYPCQEVAT